MSETFDEFFRRATGRSPYPYQRRLAEGAELPSLLQAPTGSGKTYAVVVAWLRRRRFHPDERVRRATPRRLVYCLPMRTLVEQTRKVAREVLERLDLLDGEHPVRLAVLMGGEDAGDWQLYPEDDAILIGTQDMLLSRALNRGYALSRFAWPIPFALLNNDALWVLDEVQLMANGLATTAQLDGFRAALATHGTTRTLWMSATIDPAWLDTYDSRIGPGSDVWGIDEADRAQPELGGLLRAPKTLRQLPLKPPRRGPERARAVAEAVARIHVPGSLTLVVVNTVARAQAIHGHLAEAGLTVVLIHSRFRPPERQQKLDQLLAGKPEGLIAIATQVVEAGIDVSARKLVTELAPWPSLVQRFGRCNRRAEHGEAEVFWIDLDESREAAPYEPDLLTRARSQLEALDGRSIAPDGLPPATDGPPRDHVLRRRDLFDLFDTTPDLAGADVDVARFVRGTDEMDVSLFWRAWGLDEQPDEEPAPRRDELCPAPIGDVKKFAQRWEAYRWDHMDDKWARVGAGDIRPGDILLLPARAGGYEPTIGWDGQSRTPVEPVPAPARSPRPEATGADPTSALPTWLSLAQHTDDVAAELESILARLGDIGLTPDDLSTLHLTARWHDAGKSHPIFQATLRRGSSPPEGVVLAKAPGGGRRHARRYFRHELASAIAFLKVGPSGWSDLAAYLIAAHHGKVRLAIRAAPGEDPVVDGNRCALGIHDGDVLGAADLGAGVFLPSVTLDLELARLGRGQDGAASWLERTAGLREQLGPFRLAYLEALLRCADVRASQREGGKA